VFIDSRGNILGRKIVKSSGNPSYDDEVLATIDRSAPFPAPPEKFVAIVSVEGILIGFPE
jgi:colicin import membrane protein